MTSTLMEKSSFSRFDFLFRFHFSSFFFVWPRQCWCHRWKMKRDRERRSSRMRGGKSASSLVANVMKDCQRYHRYHLQLLDNELIEFFSCFTILPPFVTPAHRLNDSFFYFAECKKRGKKLKFHRQDARTVTKKCVRWSARGNVCVQHFHFSVSQKWNSRTKRRECTVKNYSKSMQPSRRCHPNVQQTTNAKIQSNVADGKLFWPMFISYFISMAKLCFEWSER